MKKCIIVTITIFYSFFCANMLFAAANTWTQKADFGGTARDRAVGFSIGSKGYIGTGWGVLSDKKDFWEYDPAANTWTQKADFGGTRYGAVGFSIGTKGYIGTGGTGTTGSSFTKDFWEYDPATNTWTQKADFGGPTRFAAVGFSIGSKGYIGTGWSKDFWEYDPAANTWTQRADFGGTARNSAAGFSIGSKGYIGTGTDGSLTKDFWEYDPAANTWTRKADFGGTARWTAVGFSIGTVGYIGTGEAGVSFDSPCNDFWEYDPAANTWTRKADFGGTARFGARGFTIGSKGYIGTGESSLGVYTKDFWEYDQAALTCTYSISPTLTYFGTSVANTGTVAVTSSSSSCSWIATSNNSWITVTSGSNGSGNGTVSWSIPANSGPARTGTITIAGKTYTVMQGGTAYLLTASYTGKGMVTSGPAGISCGSDCTENYASGTAVTLTATPSYGWTFTGWSGGVCSGTSPICQVTMDSSKLVTANFADVTGPTGSASITSRDNTYLYLNLSFYDPAGITMMRFMFVNRGDPGGTTPMSSSFDNSPRGAILISSSCEGSVWQGFVPYSPTASVLAPEEYGTTDVCVQAQDGLGNLSEPTLAGQVWNGKVSGSIDPQIELVPVVSDGKVNQADGTFRIFPTLPNGKIFIPSHRPGNFNLTVKSTPGYKETTKAFSLPNNGNADVGVIVLMRDIPLDTKAPTITGATSTTGDGSYKAGGAVNITVNFSEAATSTALTITLNSGAIITTGALNNQSSWSGTYTVAAGQTSGDLNISTITGTITDAAANSTTNPAIPVGQNIADGKEIVIDTTVPVTTATPVGGSFGSAQNVTLSANEQATIYYTTNGTDPTVSSSIYSTAIPIAATTTLKFFAKDLAGNVEAIKSQTYTIYLNGIPGDLDGDRAVTLADAIVALKVMMGMQSPSLRADYVTSTADINGDGKVGLPELLYILQKAAGMRQ